MMNLIKKHKGLLIGATFSIVSFLLTFTFIIPIYSVLPGFFLEQALSKMVPNLSYAAVGKLTIALLVVILTIALLLIFRKIKPQNGTQLKPLTIVFAMLLMYLIIHPLGFYLHLGIVLNFKPDAQYLFNSVYSFPFSSLCFIIIGFLIDISWGSIQTRP